MPVALPPHPAGPLWFSMLTHLTPTDPYEGRWRDPRPWCLHRTADNKPHSNFPSDPWPSVVSSLLLTRSPAFHPGFLPWESAQVPCPQSITGQATDSRSHQLKRRHMLIFVLGYTEICGSLKSTNFSELCTMVWYL